MQPLPSERLPALDPFLLLHHIGPVTFEPYNDGLPFGPHPHRGFETVTLVLEGEVEHQDSRGNYGTVGAGGVQWMTAARGIIHAENLPADLRRRGGRLELLQLWLNLPAARKMEQPAYHNLPAERLPLLQPAEGVQLTVVAGEWSGVRGPVPSLLPGLRLAFLRLAPTASYTTLIGPSETVLCYVVRGEVVLQNQPVSAQTLVEFAAEGEEITFCASSDVVVLLAAAPPLREPVVQQGPYVMNTTTQVMEAMRDYALGRMGVFIPYYPG